MYDRGSPGALLFCIDVRERRRARRGAALRCGRIERKRRCAALGRCCMIG
jgi:hypothetical protein